MDRNLQFRFCDERSIGNSGNERKGGTGVYLEIKSSIVKIGNENSDFYTRRNSLFYNQLYSENHRHS